MEMFGCGDGDFLAKDVRGKIGNRLVLQAPQTESLQ